MATAIPELKSRRRWPRFSLRSYLLLVGLISSLFCWTFRDVARERTDVFALEQMGCSVRYEDELGSLGESMLLRRWRALTGITPFHRVAEVYGDPQVTDEVFRHLGSLQRLRELGLSCTGVTDAGLASVGELDRLHILFLSKTSVTDAGLAHLKSLTELQALGLALTNITDEGLVHLKALTRLSWLDLHGSKVTAAGVQDLQRSMPWLHVDF